MAARQRPDAFLERYLRRERRQGRRLQRPRQFLDQRWRRGGFRREPASITTNDYYSDHISYSAAGITAFRSAPDTPISTGQGFLPISIIEQFQEVWAFNLHAERWELKPVLETFAFDYVGDMAHVSLVGPAGEETIKATPGHPYWVIEGEGLDERPRGQHIQAIESDLEGGAFAAVGKAAMYAGCKLGITPFCFAPDTPISTGQGFLPISIIEQFQEVWAFDLHAERWEFKPVLETFAFDYEGDMAHVSLVGPAGEETIRATPGHPYWVIEGEGLDERPKGEHIQAIESDLEGSPVPGRWVDAGDLRAATCSCSRIRRRCAWSAHGWSRTSAKCITSSSATYTTTPWGSMRRWCIIRARPPNWR